MKTTQNTILITGGSAGIGFAIAKLFSGKGNHVIITGRNKANLDKAASQLQNVTAIACDVSNAEEVNSLVEKIRKDFGGLNIVINNAAAASLYKLTDAVNAFENASEEILTNYLSVVRLNEKLLPLLTRQEEAAIVNVSSIVSFVPARGIPTYSASKAALHSYTDILRITLEHTSVRVFEVMPPLVNTQFSKDLGGENGIAPEVVADDLLYAFENNIYEIHVGGTADMFNLFHADPQEALKVMNAE